MTWKILAEQQPELAAFGAERLNGRVAYLATIRKDGSPRVHPMTPIIGQGHLFVFMEPTSPKGHDLQRDGRYAIHCAVSDNSGASGEFSITGHAHLIDDAELRALAVSCQLCASGSLHLVRVRHRERGFDYLSRGSSRAAILEERRVRQSVIGGF